MTITIDVPDNLVREAASRGISVEAHIQEQLRAITIAEYERRGFTRFGHSTRSVDEAVDSILENRKRSTLGPDVTIKQLIDEGRRYP